MATLRQLGYLKTLRTALGDFFMCADTNRLTWRFWLIDVPTKRAMGVIILTDDLKYLTRKLEDFGFMILTANKYPQHGPVHPSYHASVLTIRLPENVDVQKRRRR